MRSSLLTAAALGVAVLTSHLSAQAFCLTHGCSDRAQDCAYDANGCLQTGPLLHWASSCVSFNVQKDGSVLRGITYDAAHGAVVKGFLQWLNADCGNGQGPSISVNDYGPAECRTPEYNQDAPNANVFMFRDDTWPYENAIDTLALTTLIFNAESGEIYDADVEVNTFQTQMAIERVGPLDIDFNSVITHEIGHFLGLSHSSVTGATMRPSYSPGQTEMASLSFDDAQGICAALPPDREVASTSCEPRHGFSSECVLPETSCAYRPARSAPLPSALLAALGLSWLLLRKKSRPSSPQP